MSKLVFQDVSMRINGIDIVEHLSFTATGLCCVLVSPNCGDFRDTLLLFSKTYMHSGNEIKTEGLVFFDGRMLPASKFHYLLNQYIVFEGNESVIEGLRRVNKEEAEGIARSLEIHFGKKRTDHLSVQESRVFEVAVALATKPPVIYIRMSGMSGCQGRRSLELLRRHAARHECVVLIECDEFSGRFESALAVEETGVHSLEREEARRLFRWKQLAAVGVRAAELPRRAQEVPRGGEPYDYAGLFRKYRTEKAVDLKHKKMTDWERLTTLDFYKVNLRQAVSLGYRKYEMTFQKYEKRMGVVKSLFPTFMLILALRLFGSLTRKDAIGCALNALPLVSDALLAGSPLPVIVAFCADSPARLFVHFFRDFTPVELRLVFGSICFSIMYQSSSIFDEDYQALNYNINVLMTPGTYIASVFIFTVLTHISTFLIIGLLFSLPLVFLNLTSAFFINLIYFSFLGKRLKTTFIGFFIASCIFTAMLCPTRPIYPLVLVSFHMVFPILIEPPCGWVGIFSFPYCIGYTLAYCVFIYMIICHRISSY